MKKRLAIYLIISLSLIFTVVGCTNVDNVEEPEEERYVPVEIETANERTISNEVTLSGRVFADQNIMVFPKVPGKVTDVRVSVGNKVQKGAVLFSIDKEDVQKQVDQAQVALEGAQTSYEMNKEKMENAKENLERTRQLFEQGAVSQSQLEQAELAASDKSLEAIKVQLNQAQLGYDQARKALNDLTVTAPVSGTITSVDVQTGGMATNAQPAVSIASTDKSYVQINVTGALVNKLSIGQTVDILISAVSDETIKAEIASVSPAVDQRTQLFPIKIYIDNQNQKIKPGMFAEVKVDTDTRQNVIAVKSEAIVSRGDKSFVYLSVDNKAVEREVTLGLDTGEYVEIVSGVNKDDQIIIKGQDYVEDGSTVKVVRGDK